QPALALPDVQSRRVGERLSGMRSGVGPRALVFPASRLPWPRRHHRGGAQAGFYQYGRLPQPEPQPTTDRMSRTIQTQNNILAPAQAVASAAPNPKKPKRMASSANTITSPSI